VASARLTPLLVEQMVSVLTTNPDRCVVMAPDMTRNPRIVRDGRRQTLHRYLFERLSGVELARGMYLLPGGCDTAECLNPWHHVLTDTPAERMVCPNGHRYRADDAPGRYRCRICYEARKARRRKPREPQRRCHNGHRLTKATVYQWTDKNGKRHRRCRRCQIEAQRNYRARHKENR